MEEGGIFMIVVMFIMFVILIGMVGCPTYNVYTAGKAGEAELAQATFNRQIAVQEAEAKKEAAVKLAEAEVARAEGVAKANKIIGDSLKDNDEYLKYLWITDVAGANVDKSVVYIPTEGNLPILEAGKRN